MNKTELLFDDIRTDLTEEDRQFMYEVNKIIEQKLSTFRITTILIAVLVTLAVVLVSFMGIRQNIIASIKTEVVKQLEKNQTLGGDMSQSDMNSVKNEILNNVRQDINKITVAAGDEIKVMGERVLGMKSEIEGAVKNAEGNFSRQIDYVVGRLVPEIAKISARVFAVKNGAIEPSKSGLNTGWVFFSQKKKGEANYASSSFTVVRNPGAEKGREWYPYKGSVVECKDPAIFVRETPPYKKDLKSVIGSLRKGERTRVDEVEEVKDSQENTEIWIKVQIGQD
ncbi:MAG: hypothetical protein BWK80_08570 [Desulfobacteraceae bacterium IS3]|nr:MAG: hypothetical protein BWK80_08570 [Desulfobacteraceae bacterium IS3]